MLDVVVDGQCPLPGLAGLRQFAGGVACVAEVDKDRPLCGGVGNVPAEGERGFEVGCGLGEVAEAKLDVAEGVPDGMPEAVVAAVPGGKGKCLLAGCTGPLVVAKESVVPADAGERFGFPEVMADSPGKAERLSL
jgi:hypothetical protein